MDDFRVEDNIVYYKGFKLFELDKNILSINAYGFRKAFNFEVNKILLDNLELK